MIALVKKMSSLRLLWFRVIGGSVCMAAAMIMMPVGILIIDASLLLNPYVLGVVLAAMLFFGLVGYFYCIRPYFIYRKLPDVMVETDGEFLYIHLIKKEVKIPLSDLDAATVYCDLPFLYQKEFWDEIIMHLGSEQYGTVTLELMGHGTYKMKFVAYAQDTADKLIEFMQALFDRADAENGQPADGKGDTK